MNVQGMQQQSLVKNEPLGHSDTLVSDTLHQKQRQGQANTIPFH